MSIELAAAYTVAGLDPAVSELALATNPQLVMSESVATSRKPLGIIGEETRAPSFGLGGHLLPNRAVARSHRWPHLRLDRLVVMNGRRIAALVGGVVVLVLVGVGITSLGDDSSTDTSLANERENPFGNEALGTEPPGDDDSIGTVGPTLAPIGTVGPTLPPTTRVLDTSVPVLVYAEARVTLGGGARYAYLGDPADQTEYNELLREASERVEGREDLADPDPDVYQVVTNAACAVAQENIVRLTRGGPAFRELGSIAFGADFRIDQENFFSIADNGEGVVTGGLSQGDGSRTGSEQWEIFAGSLNFLVSRLEVGDDEALEGIVDGSLTVPLVFVIAAWQGTSIENFSGDEESGHAIVTCVWQVPE